MCPSLHGGGVVDMECSTSQGRRLKKSDQLPRKEWFMRMKTLSQAILLFGLMVAPCLAIAAEPTFKEGWFTTNDGVKLHYLEAGSGNPLVMIPGWSQSAIEFKYQLAGLSYHTTSTPWTCAATGNPPSRTMGTAFNVCRRTSASSLWRTI